MKLTIDRNALMRALSHVQAVVERRNTIPILSNILLQAEGDRLSLTATDLDIEATDAAEASVNSMEISAVVGVSHSGSFGRMNPTSAGITSS